jgi:hypothetical protein
MVAPLGDRWASESSYALLDASINFFSRKLSRAELHSRSLSSIISPWNRLITSGFAKISEVFGSCFTIKL